MPTMQNVAPTEINTGAPTSGELSGLAAELNEPNFTVYDGGLLGCGYISTSRINTASGGPLTPINETLQLGPCEIVIKNPA